MRFQLEWSICVWDHWLRFCYWVFENLGAQQLTVSWTAEFTCLEDVYVLDERNRKLYLSQFVPKKISVQLGQNFLFWSSTFIQLFKIAQSLESEDFTDTLNTSPITGPHTKLLHSNWNSHRFLYPCCTSHVEFLSLRGSASSRVPTPLNSDVTSSLPVVRVTPITNILHFSLVSSAMWNAARGPNYPWIISESGHQAVSLSSFVNYSRMRFCAGRL